MQTGQRPEARGQRTQLLSKAARSPPPTGQVVPATPRPAACSPHPFSPQPPGMALGPYLVGMGGEGAVSRLGDMAAAGLPCPVSCPVWRVATAVPGGSLHPQGSRLGGNTASHIPEGRVWQTFRLPAGIPSASSHVTWGLWLNPSASWSPPQPEERMRIKEPAHLRAPCSVLAPRQTLTLKSVSHRALPLT